MEKNYKRKMLVIGVVFLFLGASATLCVNARAPWTENFDSYTAGSALHGQGGWAAWDNVATNTGYVSNAQSQSPSNSLEIAWFSGNAADMVHTFTDINTGTWNFIAYQYIPSTMTGNTYFILMNKYTAGTAHNSPDWSLQLEASRSGGYIRDFDNTAASLPIITNTWVEIRVEINFDTDSQIVYYDDQQFISKGWSDGVAAGGQVNLACVDLWADQYTSTSAYYDDLSVLPVTNPLICNANGPYAGEVDDVIQFNGTASGGWAPYTWEWDFGDGATSTEQNPTHAYNEAGEFDVVLTVTDSLAQIASSETTATITSPQPVIEIGAATGGLFKINAIIKNTGDAVATNVSWSINLNGGIILLGKESTGSLTTIAAGGQQTITSKMIIGLGKPTITITAGTATKDVPATVLLFFIKI